MKRLRTTWMALMGGILLVTLSISAAFGAPPSDDEGPRGQTVAGFVHELIFGEQAPDDEPEQEEEEQEEEQEESEDVEELDEEQVDEEQVEEEQVEEESDTHGACVSEVAHDKDGENDPEDADYASHGERVSDAARDLCRETDEDEEIDEEVVEEDEPESEDESESHGACVSEVAKDKTAVGINGTHGWAVSEAARFTCRNAEADEEDPEALEEEEDDEDGSTASAGPGKSGDARAHGKANAPGQQKVHASGADRGGRPAWAGGGGSGRGGR